MMEVVEGRSSSVDLSSAPNSDIESPFPVQPVPPRAPIPNISSADGAISLSRFAEPAGVLSAGSAGAPATGAGFRQDSAIPVKQRKPRQKKDPSTNPTANSVKKEKAPRKPRASAGTASTSKRKPKVENNDTLQPLRGIDSAAQLQHSKLVQPASFTSNPPIASSIPPQIEAAKTSQNGISTQPSKMMSYVVPASHIVTSTPPPQPSPSRSGIYDPVRSLFTREPEPTPTLQLPHVPQTSFHQNPHRASASPAISSIIDPPDTQRHVPTPIPQAPPISHNTPPQSAEKNGEAGPRSSVMDLDVMEVSAVAPRKTSLGKRSSEEGPTRPSSPKPQRVKEQPLPAAGTGLLSSSLFGGSTLLDGAKDGSGERQNIIIHVDLKNEKNRVINFARMAEEKYGFAALYPRQAAQRERLARVAAAGAALERSASGSKGGGSAGESGDDDVSVDIDRDSDEDRDVAMSGMNGQEAGNSGTDGVAPKKRRKKTEEYNQDDPFIDDSELLWEAQAAASKDGFFVWCGPLVPEGEKPNVERADGTVKRGRGRGRGGGPGSRGGRGAAAAARAAAAAEGNQLPSRGPGSRGGGLTRKPRGAKSEKVPRESEKGGLEKASTPTLQPATPSGHDQH